MNEHKFDQRSEVYKHLSTKPTHRFDFKQLEILGSIIGQKKLLLLESLPVVVLVSVQGVQNGGPHFQFTRFEGGPIFRLRAFKDL